MIRVAGLVVIGGMTSETGSWCIRIACCMAFIAFEACMSSLEYIIIAVNCKTGRFPSGNSGMTGIALGRKIQCDMIWIRSLVKVAHMATGTGIGCSCIVAFMTGFAIHS